MAFILKMTFILKWNMFCKVKISITNSVGGIFDYLQCDSFSSVENLKKNPSIYFSTSVDLNYSDHFFYHKIVVILVQNVWINYETLLKISLMEEISTIFKSSQTLTLFNSNIFIFFFCKTIKYFLTQLVLQTQHFHPIKFKLWDCCLQGLEKKKISMSIPFFFFWKCIHLDFNFPISNPWLNTLL